MNAAIILSGGTGTRLGSDIPKQYLKVGNRTILSYSMERIFGNSLVDVVAIVCDTRWQSEIETDIHSDKPVMFCTPGQTRQLSILNGLNTLQSNYGDQISKVIIHDGARPNVSEKLITECFDACADGYDGVLPVIGVKDTVYQSNDRKSISALLDRSTLFCGQAPEAFDFVKYLHAHTTTSIEELLKINGSSEIAYKCGMKIRMIPGDPLNFKITDVSDLEQFKSLQHES